MLIDHSVSIEYVLRTHTSDIIDRRSEHKTLVLVASLPGLDIDVLNVFAPRGKAFWSFGLFQAQLRKMEAFADLVRSDALKRIDEQLKHMGIPRKSVNSYEFLAPLTKGAGLEYYPYSPGSSTGVPYWWFAQRHLCLVCPTDKTTGHLEYLGHVELEVKENCYVDVADDFVFVDLSQYTAFPEYAALNEYVGNLSDEGRKNVQKTLQNEGFLESVDQGILNVLGRSEGPNISLLEPLSDHRDENIVRAILRRRAELGLKFSTLQAVERMPARVSDFWNAEDQADILDAIDALMRNYPVIESTID